MTRRWPQEVEAELSELGDVVLNPDDQALTPTQLGQALADCDVLCATVTDQLTAGMFSAGVRTRLIANFGVGYNHIDVAAARSAGVRVTNTPGVLTEATAEIALSLLLASARRTSEGERHLRGGEWTGWRPTHMLSTQVTGKTLGIVGMGRIGTRLARMAYHGLGMRILYANRNPVAESVAVELQAQRLPLEQLLGEADFVSLHCPATAETRHLIDSRALSLMRPCAHLINTARGDVVDEQALVRCLSDGTIAGAGLDVFEHEPRLAEGLAALENVVLLPHMGSGTQETRVAMGRCALSNVRAFLTDQALPNEVTV